MAVMRGDSGFCGALARAGQGMGLGLLLVAMLAPQAMAQDEGKLPSGKFGLSLGVRQGIGRLGGDYGLGMVGAVEAGYHPTAADRALSAGLSWSVVWSWFGPDDQASITGSLHLLEFNFGAELRRLIDEPTARFLSLGTGISLLRANVPIPPDQARVYLGPYVSAGIEQFAFGGDLLISFEARYGLIVGGPGTISFAIGVGFGT